MAITRSQTAGASSVTGAYPSRIPAALTRMPRGPSSRTAARAGCPARYGALTGNRTFPRSAGLARRLLTTRDDRDVYITGGEAIGKNKKTDRNTVGVKDLELKGSKDVKGADLPTAVEYEVISVAAASR